MPEINPKTKTIETVDVASASSSDEARGSFSSLEPYNSYGAVSYLQTLEDLPQGRHLGIYLTIILFVSRIVGSGIFATPSSIYEDVGGSPFLFFLAWILAAAVAFAGLYVYLELGSLIPRSGGTKVFLEVIYERPAYFVTTIFSIYSIIFGFTLLNALVFGEYFLHSIGVENSDFRSRMVGLAFIWLSVFIHGFSVHHGIRIQNVMGALKLGLLAAMSLTGIYAIFIRSYVTGIPSNLTTLNFFENTSKFNSSTFASAIIKASFSFSGWNAVHTVTSEIKDPNRTFKIAGPVSLAIVAISYVITNIAYLVIIPSKEITGSGKLIGSLLFEKVLGETLGRHVLALSIALSSAGNILVVTYTISRVSQEVFREGVLPFSGIMASNWPCGSPLATLVLSATMSTVVCLLTLHNDIYNYIIALEGYPGQLFTAMVTVGIFIIRKRRPDVRAPIRANFVGIIVILVITLYLIVSPLISKVSPNPKGTETWISYPILAIACLLFCASYWFVMFKVKPYLYGYEIVSEDVTLHDGLVVKRWVKLFL